MNKLCRVIVIPDDDGVVWVPHNSHRMSHHMVGETGWIPGERHWKAHIHIVCGTIAQTIASTDPNVEAAGIREAFTRAFVKSNGEIREVLVEYEELMGDTGIVAVATGEDDIVPKLRDDGTIIIHSAKTYNLQQVKALCESAHAAGWINKETWLSEPEAFEDWFEKNVV